MEKSTIYTIESDIVKSMILDTIKLCERFFLSSGVLSNRKGEEIINKPDVKELLKLKP